MSVQNYGLTVGDLNYSKQKITKQRDYLTKNTFVTENGEVKSLLDVSYSANHSERYYAQLLNKIHTMDSYNLYLSHSPIFMTVTLDAPFHEMIDGNFKKFYKKYKIAFGQIIEKSTGEIVNNLVPNNDRYGFLIDAIEQERRLSVKDLYRILSYQMHGFQKSYIFKKIRKDGNEVSYLRVTEPMKSGVPHFHLLLYTRDEYIKGLYDSFHKYFSAPQNKKPLTWKQNKRVCTKPLEDGTEETQGFQWDIKSATGYVLKYVLKSFRNVEKNEDIDYLQSWYIKNRIPRIITSHTLIPQWVYHLLSVVEKDWYYYSQLRTFHSFSCDIENKTFEFHDRQIDRTITYDNGLLRIYRGDKLMISHGKKMIRIKRIRLKSLIWSTTKAKSFNLLTKHVFYKGEFDKRPHKEKYFHDDTQLMTSNGGLEFMLTFLEDLDEPILKKLQSVKEMSDLTLFNFYKLDDIETMNPHKYANIQNEMVRRELITKPIVNLNNFTLNSDIIKGTSTFLSNAQEEIFKSMSMESLNV